MRRASGRVRLRNLRPPVAVGAVRDLTPGLASPVRTIATDSGEEPESGVALCLSGGGYRAMLFHLGVIWRLREAGWLERLDRVSSVSGGSITRRRSRWPGRGSPPTGFEAAVVGRRCARSRGGRSTGPRWSRARCCPARSPSSSPAPTASTSSATRCWGPAEAARLHHQRDQRRSRGRCPASSAADMADWRVGSLPDPDIPLATAVACLVRVPAGTLALPAATRWSTGSTRRATTSGPRRAPRGAVPLGRRRLRQPRPRDRLEALPHRDRLRRRRPDGARGPTPPTTGRATWCACCG